MNPSSADAYRDDPTIRRVIGFARSWGYGRLGVVNLFAYRTTSPQVLTAVSQPIGPDNDDYIVQAVTRSALVIVAWGCNGHLHGRDVAVLRLVRRHCTPYYLALTAQGYPKHPLYIRGDATPLAWAEEGTRGLP